MCCTCATSGLPSLTCLELDRKCFEYINQRTHHLATGLGQLTRLQALLLNIPGRHKHQRTGDMSRIYLGQWQAAIQPLTGLTRLQLGFVNLGAVNGWGIDQAQVPEAVTACLQRLQDLQVSGFDMDERSWALEWVGRCRSLTSLDIPSCSASEVDFEVLGQLQQLASLSLHYYRDEAVTSPQLAPLTSCTRLTALHVDSLVIEPAQRRAAAGARAADASESGAAGATEEAAAWVPQLTSLRKLRAGVLACAPVATLAPHLTQLRDVCVRHSPLN